MIKFAVQRPNERRQDIMANVAALDWNQDRYLTEFGVKINPTMPVVPARLIENPEVQYANGKVNPGTSGRWDLRGKKFVSPNAMPLTSWAFVVTENCIDKPSLENFIRVFTQTYQNHGGRIESKPLTFVMPRGKQHHEMVEEVYMGTGKANKATPQIIFFVLRDRTAWIYERMKKNADCRWACLTQMMQVDHVRKAQPQYCSNVCMKVNSKLGGQTSRIPSQGAASAFFKVPTMMIGVDVSHAAAGSNAASMAAMCFSMDKDAATYVATCETNGHRVEILTPVNIRSMMPDVIKMWCQKNKTTPQHVFYFRDGVGEGQFSHVLEWEIDEVRRAFEEAMGKVPKITVIIATKRHQIRIFPEKGDKNGNPLPGTLVEREVTHPFHYDFYLCSHVAIQGTARPCHYHVIHDEIGMQPDDLQRMIYHQCYQYARSTTPVSLHPAIYYAHLAGARARSHENLATSDQVPRYAKDFVMGKFPGALAKHDDSGSVSTSRRSNPPEAVPLLPMGGAEAREDAKQMFKSTMWYI
jgi:eukaryotic translation initiation factor 2C